MLHILKMRRFSNLRLLEYYKWGELNEYVSNYSLARHIIEKFFNNLKKNSINAATFVHISDREILFYMKPGLEQWDDAKKDYIEKVINKNLNIFPANNFIVGYRRKSNEFTFFLKSKFTKRYFPNQGYLYHTTTMTENLLDISKNGLELRSSTQSKEWAYQEELTYPPAIFATVPPTTWSGKIDDRVIKINTKNLPNKWWFDLNLYHSPWTGNYVITYESIPAKYLEFYSKNEKYKEGYKWVPATEYFK